MARRSQFSDPSPGTATRACDMPGCDCAGQFRAPQARDRLNDYYWFCLDHVRQYNLSWDYYSGMAPDEIEAHLREDTTWQRPTWPLGKRQASTHRGNGQPRFRDDFGFFHGEDETAAESVHPDIGGGTGADRTRRRRGNSPEDRALVLFELDLPITLGEVKARYKELVKRHHPDANGGDKAAEERLKLINEAYATLRASLSPT